MLTSMKFGQPTTRLVEPENFNDYPVRVTGKSVEPNRKSVEFHWKPRFFP